MSEHSAEIDDVLSALAEPIRRRVLDVIAGHGDASATAVAAELPISRQAVSNHLAILEEAGLVAGHRQGRDVRYVVRPEPLDATARWLARLADEWDTRLPVIKRLAESE